MNKQIPICPRFRRRSRNSHMMEIWPLWDDLLIKANPASDNRRKEVVEWELSAFVRNIHILALHDRPRSVANQISDDTEMRQFIWCLSDRGGQLIGEA